MSLFDKFRDIFGNRDVEKDSSFVNIRGARIRNLQKLLGEGINVESNVVDIGVGDNYDLILKIGKDRFDRLCKVYNKDSSYFSVFFLNLLVEKSDFLDKLCDNILYDLFDKINNNSYSIFDISKYDRWVINYLPFYGRDKIVVNMIENKVVLDKDKYYGVEIDDISDLSSIREGVDVKIQSYFDGMDILVDRKECVPILTYFNCFIGKKIKIINPVIDNRMLFINIFDIFYDKVDLNKNTIICMDYDLFLKLSKDDYFLDKISECNLVFDDEYDKLDLISSKLINSKLYYGSDNGYDSDLIKLNCLLYVIENSDLSDDKKGYYVYNAMKYTRSNNYIGSIYIVNYVSILLEEIGRDKVSILVGEFNELSLDEKCKDVEEVEFKDTYFIGSIDDFDSLTVTQLLEKMQFLSSDERRIVFNSDLVKGKIKNIFRECDFDQWRYFRYIFINKLISADELFGIISAGDISKFYKNNNDRYEYIFFGALCESDVDSVFRIANRDINLFKEFYYSFLSEYSFDSSGLSYDCVIDAIFMIKEIGGDYSRFMSNISARYQYALLKENLSDDMLAMIVSCCNVEVIQFFVDNDRRFEKIYNKLDLIKLSNKGIKFSEEFLSRHNSYIFDMLKHYNLIQFRYNIDCFSKNNGSLDLINKFDKYEDDIINSFDVESGIFREYNSIISNLESVFGYNSSSYSYVIDNDFISDIFFHGKFKNDEDLILFLRNVSISKLCEVVIDRLFKDNIYNVYLNIGEMIRYNSFLRDDEKVIDKDKLEFYNTVLNMDKLSGREIIELYNRLKDRDIGSVYYDDIRKLKDKSYDNIKKVLFNPVGSKDGYSEVLSDKYGVDIYDYRDKKYTMLVRCLSSEYRDSNINRRDCYTLLNEFNNMVLYSDRYIYGYSGFDNDTVLHIFERDAFSSNNAGDMNIVNKQVNRIMTPEQIILSSFGINEVQIVNRKKDDNRAIFETVAPSYMVVYDEVDDKVVKEAVRLGIPIVIIKNNKFNRDIYGGINYTDVLDDYVYSYYDVSRRKPYSRF